MDIRLAGVLRCWGKCRSLLFFILLFIQPIVVVACCFLFGSCVALFSVCLSARACIPSTFGADCLADWHLRILSFYSSSKHRRSCLLLFVHRDFGSNLRIKLDLEHIFCSNERWRYRMVVGITFLCPFLPFFAVETAHSTIPPVHPNCYSGKARLAFSLLRRPPYLSVFCRLFGVYITWLNIALLLVPYWRKLDARIVFSDIDQLKQASFRHGRNYAFA